MSEVPLYGANPDGTVEWDIDFNVPMYTRDYLRLLREGTDVPLEDIDCRVYSTTLINTEQGEG